MNNFKVSKSMSLLISSGNLLSPYNKICIRKRFCKFVYPNGRNRAITPARRSLRGSAKGQSNKKCSVSSIPSFVGNIGFKVSLKLYLNL